MIFDKKNAVENPPQDQKRKMPSWFKGKVKIVAMMVVFALLWGQVPVGATVNDNLSTVLQKLIGAKTDTIADSYDNSSVHANRCTTVFSRADQRAEQCLFTLLFHPEC